MQPDLQTISAVTLVIGSIIFGLGAGITNQFWIEPTPEAKLKWLQAHPRVWPVGQVGFGLGASVAAMGLALAAPHLQARGAGGWIYLAAALALLGVMPWDWQVWLRAIKPVDFVKGLLPSWLYPVYALLTICALILIGAALIQAGYPVWLGVLSIVYPLLLLVAYLVFHDLPPFTYYLLTLVIGIVMLS